MELVEVNVVGAQAAQARLAGLLDVRRAGIPASHISGVLIEGQPKLRRDQHAIAPASKRLADDALALSRAIYVGRVDEIDPAVETHLDGPHRLALVDLPPAKLTAAKLGRAADGPAAQT